MTGTKTCFVITSFTPDSKTLLNTVVRPTVEDMGFVCRTVDDFFLSGSIVESVITSIRNSEIAIAILDEQNPNVYYELGVAHALGRATILLAPSLNRVPLDIQEHRILIYENSKIGRQDLTSSLRTALGKFMESGVVKQEKIRSDFRDWIDLVERSTTKEMEFQRLVSAFLRSMRGIEVMDAKGSNQEKSSEIADMVVWNQSNRSPLSELGNPILVECKASPLNTYELEALANQLQKTDSTVLLFYLGSGTKFRTSRPSEKKSPVVFIPVNKITFDSLPEFEHLLRKAVSPTAKT